MKNAENFLQRVPLYPILIGLYAVMFLWGANFEQVPTYAVGRSLLIALGVCLVAFLVGWAIARNLRKGAALAGLAMALFFTFGHILNLLETVRILNINLGRFRYLGALWLLLLVLLGWRIVRSKSNFLDLTAGINFVMLVMLVFVCAPLAWKLLLAERAKIPAPKPVAAASTTANTGQPRRDVYYILIDRYGREDLLENIGVDERPIIQQVKDLGFIIPRCTQSNYQGTELAMTSTLNMNYLGDLGIPVKEMMNWGSSSILYHTIQTNQVFDIFRSLGYQVITFKSSFPFIDFKNSDIVYDPEASEPTSQKLETLNFLNTFLDTTPITIINQMAQNNPERFEKILPQSLYSIINPKDPRFSNYYYKQYQFNLYSLRKIKETPQAPGLKFFYAHIYITHKPFTFRPNGDFRWPIDDNNDAYKDQVLYMNTQLAPMLKSILDQYKGKPAPIIIVQGDHSNGIHYNRFKILNAYYLPGLSQDQLAKIDDHMTPVNTFRFLFDAYFNKNYPLLPNQSWEYLSTTTDTLSPVPQSCLGDPIP